MRGCRRVFRIDNAELQRVKCIGVVRFRIDLHQVSVGVGIRHTYAEAHLAHAFAEAKFALGALPANRDCVLGCASRRFNEVVPDSGGWAHSDDAVRSVLVQ